MNLTKESPIGYIVKSIAGRDKKREFVIVDIDIDSGDYVYIADGKLRPAGNPKRKKLKHLLITGKCSTDVINRISNGSHNDKLLYEIVKERSQQT